MSYVIYFIGGSMDLTKKLMDGNYPPDQQIKISVPQRMKATYNDPTCLQNFHEHTEGYKISLTGRCNCNDVFVAVHESIC
jgi:hypothetical protein